MLRCLVLLVLLTFSTELALAQSRAEITDEVDLFAVAHLDKVQVLSFRDKVEYCGLFGYDSSGKLAATEPRRGDVDGCDPGIEPAGFEVFASYHTHGAYSRDADSEVPSVDDLLGDFEEEIDGYVATPGGRVWLNLLDERRTFQLCGRNCIRADPNFRTCPAFPPGTEHTIKSLQAREDSDTGEC